MKYNKIIYIRYIPLTIKIYEDFYFRQVSALGVNVEYWDISKLFFRTMTDIEDVSYLCNTLFFNTYRQLEEKISLVDCEHTLFISIMTLDGGQRKLYSLFARYNCKLGVFGRNMFPQYSISRKFFLERIFRITLSKLIIYFNHNFLMRAMRSGQIKGYDVVFLGGSNGWQGIGNIGKEIIAKAENIKVNSDDYDIYLKIKDDKNRILDKNYILFLDEYLPFHPDTKLFGIRNVMPDEYYPQLNAYFDRVEEQFGLSVVIAAHPKALRYKKKDFFNGRSVYYGKSATLSKDADFVLAHDSTSINFPIAFGKRLHFITSDNIAKAIPSVHLNVISFAKYLGCNVQYFDRIDEVVNVVEEVEIERYTAYKYDYQTSPETENRLSESIFIDYLNK